MGVERGAEKPQISDVELGIMLGVGVLAVGGVHVLERGHRLMDSLIRGTAVAAKGAQRLRRNVLLTIRK